MNSFRYVAHQKVVINLKSGTAIAGVVTSKQRMYCVVKDAEVIEPGAPAPMRADGEIVVHRTDIDYIQLPEGRVK